MYGVDECRRCGAKIQPLGGGDRIAFVRMMRSRTVMPEAQWRAMGLLAPPTKKQMYQPADGCCYACGVVLMGQKHKPLRRISYVLVVAIGALAAISFVGTYLLY